MAFITKILPQVINVAKKISNPITSKIPTSVEDANNLPITNSSADNLFNYASSAVSGSVGNVDQSSFASSTGTALTDLRIKISMPPGATTVFYQDLNNLLLDPLRKTKGFVFPIQPDIAMSHSAEYQSTKPTHSNFPYYHYTNSEIQQISITGDFPIRSIYDARYVNAGIHFLRSCTRMFNSKDGNLAGYPPMVLRLYGLGFTGFDNLPVVVTSVNVSYPSSVDFITFKPFERLTETAKMPTSLTIQVSLNPVFSRDYITNTYSTLDYSKGAGMLGVGRSVDKLAPAVVVNARSESETQQDFDFMAEQSGGSASAADYGYTPPQQPGTTTSGPRIPGSPAGFGGSIVPQG
jgi:hypothetical protein